MKGWIVGSTKNGKIRLRLTGYDVVETTRLPDGTWFDNTDKAHHVEGLDTLTNPITIPCGKCLECRLAYSRNWAARCMMEASLHKSNYFVTLTYDDAHLPVSVSNDDGEFLSSLCKKDFQDFMKRLRKQTGQKIRYFAAGEYGSKTFRPHYHAILFGLSLSDLVLYRKTSRGDFLYNSATLQAIWQKGFVVVGECTYESAAYTARYVVKKALDDQSEKIEDLGLEPEFVLMSRKPGIAKDFYDSHKAEFAEYGHVFLPTRDGRLKISAPRYFKGFLEVDAPEKFFDSKHIIEAAAETGQDLLLSLSSKDYLSLCKDREDFKKAKMKALERSL